MRAFHRCDSYYKVNVPLPVRTVYAIALVIPCMPISGPTSMGAPRLTSSGPMSEQMAFSATWAHATLQRVRAGRPSAVELPCSCSSTWASGPALGSALAG